MYKKLFFLGLFFSFTSILQAADDLHIRKYKDHMHYLTKLTGIANDSIQDHYFNKFRYFNSDSLFHLLARVGYPKARDEMHYYYNDILPFLPEERRLEEVAKMRKAAIRYHSDLLKYESDYFYIISLNKMKPDKVNLTLQYISAAVKRKDIRLELSLRSYLFRQLIWEYQFAQAFRHAPELIKKLDRVTDDEFSERCESYFYLGDAYYAFQDYDRAIPLLKKALRDSVSYFGNRFNLKARNTLAVYYANKNELDSSDYYFRSMYDSPDMVRSRPMYDVIAIFGLAKNRGKRGEHEKALRLFYKCLPEALKENDYAFSSGITVEIADYQLKEGNLVLAKEMIDSTRALISLAHGTSPYLDRDKQLYALLSRYYAVTGNSKLAQEFLDSTLVATKQQAERSSGIFILKGEQEVFEVEKAEKDHQIILQKKNVEVRNRSLVFLSAGLVLLVFIIFLIVNNSRKIKKRNQHLFDQIEAYNKARNQLRNSIPKNGGGNLLFSQVEQLMENEKLYLNSEFSRKDLFAKVKSNEVYVSNAIKEATGMTIQEYVNFLRLEYSVNALLENPNQTIESISIDSGFVSVRNFYRLFKSKYGMSPSEFRAFSSKENIIHKAK